VGYCAQNSEQIRVGRDGGNKAGPSQDLYQTENHGENIKGSGKKRVETILTPYVPDRGFWKGQDSTVGSWRMPKERWNKE